MSSLSAPQPDGGGGEVASEPHSRMSEATKIMIQESVIQGRVNSHTRGLLQENHQLQEVTEGLKIPVGPLENREQDMATCSLRSQGPRQYVHGCCGRTES